MAADILAILQELNFTEYEAKAYLTLLEKAPLSGYAVSLHSGVPRSKIYEVLGGMVNRGDLMVSQENTPLYMPLAPKELIAERKRRAGLIFEQAEQALEHYTLSALHREGIWNISGREAILGRIREALKGTKKRALLEIWSEDAEELRGDLQEAAERGVEVLIVAYGEIDFDFALVYPHDMSEQITADYGGRWIVLSADDQEVIAGIVSLGAESRAAWTMHPGLVMPITEVVIHDLYLMEILLLFRPQLEAAFGPNLMELRNKFALGANSQKAYINPSTFNN